MAKAKKANGGKKNPDGAAPYDPEDAAVEEQGKTLMEVFADDGEVITDDGEVVDEQWALDAQAKAEAGIERHPHPPCPPEEEPEPPNDREVVLIGRDGISRQQCYEGPFQFRLTFGGVTYERSRVTDNFVVYTEVV